MRASLRIALLASALASGACLEPRERPASTSPSCEGCHGTRESAAPPPGLWLSGGKTGGEERGVGAHHVHLAGDGKLALAIPCGSCHLVPQGVDDPGHLDSALPAEVVFSGLATTGGFKASFDGTSCSVYCHASSLPGGSVAKPSWTKVDGTQAACGACHGLPPGGSHPKTGTCSLCHTETVDASGAIKNRALHINGKVEVKGGGAGCSSCHGGPENAAPPVDTTGKSSGSERGVGAHQAHVRASARHAALACSECHVMPASIDAAGHMDSPLPAELSFGALAKTGSRQPSWSTASLRCSSTYCHALDGGGNPEPVWNAGEKMVCGSCHGLPPAKGRSGAAHPPSSLAGCASCHPAVVNAAGAIIAPARHVDGKVDFN